MYVRRYKSTINFSFSTDWITAITSISSIQQDSISLIPTAVFWGFPKFRSGIVLRFFSYRGLILRLSRWVLVPLWRIHCYPNQRHRCPVKKWRNWWSKVFGCLDWTNIIFGQHEISMYDMANIYCLYLYCLIYKLNHILSYYIMLCCVILNDLIISY